MLKKSKVCWIVRSTFWCKRKIFFHRHDGHKTSRYISAQMTSSYSFQNDISLYVNVKNNRVIVWTAVAIHQDCVQLGNAVNFNIRKGDNMLWYSFSNYLRRLNAYDDNLLYQYLGG